MTRIFALVSASLIALSAAPAYAQDDATEEENANSQGDIVVTATRQATRLQDTPLAVTAETSETLETRGIDSVQDLSNVVPNGNFRMNQGAYGKGVSAFIRGIGQVDTNLAAEPGVAYYIDDIYYPLVFGSQFDLLDLDRIEVLRGPQGTLYGRNALAGAVNIISKEPDFNNASASITITTGRYERFDVRAGFNLPLADNFAIRVNGSSKRRTGYQDRLDFRCEMIRRGTPALAGNFPYSDGILIQASNFTPDNCVVGHLGGEDVHAVRGVALWEPTPGLRISVIGDYTNDQSENQADSIVNIDATVAASRANITAIGNYFTAPGGTPFRYDNRFITGDPYTTFANNSDYVPAGTALPGSTFHNGSVVRGGYRYPMISPLKNYGVSGKVSYDIGDNMQVLLVGGYRYVDTIFGFDVDGSPLLLEQTRNNTGEDHWTGELRFTGTTSFVDWAVGLFYYRGHGYVHTTLSSAWNSQQRYQNHAYEPKSKAVYGNFVVKPFDGFRVTLGGRYSDDEKFVDYNNQLDGDTTGAGAIVFKVTPQDKRFDWKLGADYHFTDDIMVYGSASTGFRLPGFNARPFQPSQITQIPGDELLAYELGIKTDLFDKRARLNLTGFYTDYKTRPIAIAGQEYLLGANGQPIPVPGGGNITIPLAGGPAGSTTCRLLTQAEINANTPGFQCVSRNYYNNTPGKVKGFEVEFEAEPIDDLSINAQFGYAHFSAPDIALTLNKRVVGIPEWNASAGIQYLIDLPGLGGTVTPRLDWNYQGSIVEETNNARYNQPGYSVFNARINYHNERFDGDIAIGATNVFNKFYYQNFFVLQPFGFPQANAQPAAPREWYVSVSKRF